MFQSLAALARDIKLAHSVFALPFALLATFLAAGGWPHWGELGLILICMFFARSYAMLANRYLDRRFDADNPRTAERALPSGRVSTAAVTATVIACAVGLVVFASAFGWAYGNWLPVIFSPVVLLWLFVYAIAKRGTALCHFVLGGALALSPLAAGLAIEPAYLYTPTLWLLAGFVALWVGGFDIIYALQDIDFDREHGLHSIPAAMGRTGALLAAKIAHLVALGLLVAVYRLTPPLRYNTIVEGRQISLFLIATLIVAALLIYEHRAAARDRFTMAFFTLNGIISLIVGGLGIADVLLYADRPV